jgi:hypothetical protein
MSRATYAPVLSLIKLTTHVNSRDRVGQARLGAVATCGNKQGTFRTTLPAATKLHFDGKPVPSLLRQRAPESRANSLGRERVLNSVRNGFSHDRSVFDALLPEPKYNAQLVLKNGRAHRQ